jgi:hypothetical protein
VKEYHKIDSIFKRDPTGKFLLDEFSRPEFEYLANNLWQWTEKVDGTNIRIMWDGAKITFGGKTDNAQIPAKLLNNLNDFFFGQWKPGEDLFTEVFGTEGNVCLYGEGYGAGIQSGGNYRDTQWFVLFDVKIGHWWLQRESVQEIAKKLNLDVVPLAYNGEPRTLYDAVADIKAGGFKSQWGDFIAEGLVGTPLIPLMARNGDRIITKVKVKDFK